jgi:hypothetical protein
MGASGGAPFAAACARFIPPERLVAVGVVCPFGSFLRSPPAAASQRALLAVRFLPPWLCSLAVALVSALHARLELQGGWVPIHCLSWGSVVHRWQSRCAEATTLWELCDGGTLAME